MVCVKHYALNSMENMRFDVNVICDPASLRDVYLPHFRQVLQEGGAETVMTAYNYVNDLHCSQHQLLVDQILRNEWKCDDAVIVTDFVFGIRDAVESIKAGLDIEMPTRLLRDY